MNDFSGHQNFFSLFVQDTSVFLVDTEYAKLMELLNVELDKVSCWLNANDLALNIKMALRCLYCVLPKQD